MDAVEAKRMAYILKRAVAAIAEDAHLRSGTGFDDCSKVDPSVVVDVDWCNSPTPDGVSQRKVDTLESPVYRIRSSHVTPQRKPRRARVSHGDVHPAVLVVIKNSYARGWRQARVLVERNDGIFALARIDVDQRRQAVARHCQINRTIVVEVSENRRGCRSTSAESSRLSLFGERSVAIVAPEHIGRVARLQTRAGKQQIEIAIVIVVDKGDA